MTAHWIYSYRPDYWFSHFGHSWGHFVRYSLKFLMFLPDYWLHLYSSLCWHVSNMGILGCKALWHMLLSQDCSCWNLLSWFSLLNKKHADILRCPCLHSWVILRLCICFFIISCIFSFGSSIGNTEEQQNKCQEEALLLHKAASTIDCRPWLFQRLWYITYFGQHKCKLKTLNSLISNINPIMVD